MYGQLSQDWAVAHDLMHFQIMTPNRSAAVRIPAFCTKSHWRKFYKKDASNRAQIRRLVRSYKKIFKMVATYDGSASVRPDLAIFEGTRRQICFQSVGQIFGNIMKNATF